MSFLSLLVELGDFLFTQDLRRNVVVQHTLTGGSTVTGTVSEAICYGTTPYGPHQPSLYASGRWHGRVRRASGRGSRAYNN